MDPRQVLAQMEERQSGRNGITRRVLRLLPLLLKAMSSSRRAGLLIARWHPLLRPVQWIWQKRGGRSLVLVQGVIADLHAANPWTAKISLFERMAIMSLKSADAIVTPATGIADWISSQTGRPRAEIITIENGLNLSEFSGVFDKSPGSLANDLPDEYAIFSGNMATWQGVDVILEALAEPDWPSSLHAVFVGDGDHAELVLHSSDSRVHYMGRLDRASMIALLSDAMLALAARRDVPASSTGVSPFKVLEAAAAGVPAVVTDIAGQSTLARSLGGAIVVPPDSAKALAQGVSQLYHDASLRARLSQRAQIEAKRYSWESGASELSRAVVRAYTKNS